MNNDYPCGNTQTEIDNDQPIVIAPEEWELRHEERQRKLDARKEFIATLLRNETARVLMTIDSRGVEFYQPYYLYDAIGSIDENNEEFWSFSPINDAITLGDLFDDDPEIISAYFVNGYLDKFKSLIQLKVEELSDIVKF